MRDRHGAAGGILARLAVPGTFTFVIEDDGLDLPNCPNDSTAMEPVGEVREVATDTGRLTEGNAWRRRCPACGLVRLV